MYIENLFEKFFHSLKLNWHIFPFLIFAFFSIFWSIQPLVSLYRWAILFSTILIGGYLGISNTNKEILRILSLFGILIIFLCSLFVIILPDFGVMNYFSIQGAWRGMFWHKNHMGVIAALINIIFLFCFVENFRHSKIRVVFWGFMYIFSLYFLFQTDSVGAYLSSIFVHGIYFLLFFWLKFRHKFTSKHYVMIGILIFLFAIVIFTNLDTLFGIFNRNTTLTGRIPMWTHLFKTYFNERPFWGYGFNAFWYSVTHRESMALEVGYPDPIVIADNGFIDILVNNGIVGFSMFLIFYFGMWYRSIKLAVIAKRNIHFLPVLMMTFSFVSNLSWSFLFENESFMILILIIFLFSSTKAIDKSSQELRNYELPK